MQYRFHHIHEAPAERVEEHTRLKARSLETRLATFEADLVRLDLRLDHSRKRYGDRRDASYFEAHLVLYLPGHNLPNISATGHGEPWKTAVNEAFDDLDDQLETFLQKLHREAEIHDFQHRPSWKRPGAELLGEPQAEPVPAEDETTWMQEWDQEHHQRGIGRPVPEES